MYLARHELESVNVIIIIIIIILLSLLLLLFFLGFCCSARGPTETAHKAIVSDVALSVF